MEILASHQLEVDLSMWRPKATVRLITPGAVSVGHVADELARFLNLPNEISLHRSVIYSLAVGPASAAEGELSEASDREPAEALDRELPVAEVRDDQRVALMSTVESLVDQFAGDVGQKFNAKVDEVEAEIRGKIDAEINHWMKKGRSLVIGAFDDALDQIRGRLRTEIAGLVPSGGGGVLAQFRGSRTVKKFILTQTHPAYGGAVRTGLANARATSSLVLRWLGTAAASLGGGGLAGAGTGMATGAAAGTGAGASSGATAGAAAGLVAVGAVLAATSLGPDPVQWFVHPDDDSASSTNDAVVAALPDVGGHDDLLIDLKTKSIRIRQEGNEGLLWEPLFWPNVEEPGDGEVLDHRHNDVHSSIDHVHNNGAVVDHEHEHDHQSRIEDGNAEPTADNKADFFVNRCTGVLWGNDKEAGWQPLVELSLIDAAALTDECNPPTIRPGQSLWGLVRQVCGRASNAELAREANRTWLANLGLIGSDPDNLPSGEPVAVKCETS